MTIQEIDRNLRWRLGIIHHVEEITHYVARTCRYYGISRTAFYRWHQRYQEHGIEGLKDRFKRPHRSPKATKPEIVGKIIYLRQTYHFGPRKISQYLQRYHDVYVSDTGVWRILTRLKMSRLLQNQRYQRMQNRWKRYEKQEPGHRLHVDVKFLERIPEKRGRQYQYTAIDDCTRLRVL